ncbi:MAG TPA: hypothetical protein ENF41_03240 [Candidatus Bathyarchaeota archaeon]|nr:hypothetical protein [Candidatus Bathyarchaeota archaeon]
MEEAQNIRYKELNRRGLEVGIRDNRVRQIARSRDRGRPTTTLATMETIGRRGRDFRILYPIRTILSAFLLLPT